MRREDVSRAFRTIELTEDEVEEAIIRYLNAEVSDDYLRIGWHHTLKIKRLSGGGAHIEWMIPNEEKKDGHSVQK